MVPLHACPLWKLAGPRSALTAWLCVTQAVKVLRTAEFVPYVVFIEAPDYETLRAMNKAALESGVATKQLTVSPRQPCTPTECNQSRGSNPLSPTRCHKTLGS